MTIFCALFLLAACFSFATAAAEVSPPVWLERASVSVLAGEQGDGWSHDQATPSVWLERASVSMLAGEQGDGWSHDQATPPVWLERASVSVLAGEQGDGWSHAPTLSADGRYVIFLSDAANLVISDTNQLTDVFTYDRQTGLVELVSKAADGSPANGAPSRPAVSADGRYVVFNSDASNLVPDDNNAHQDVFVYDRQTQATERVSTAADGAELAQDSFSRRPAISDDGRYVVFYSNAHELSPHAAPDTYNVYLKDRQTGAVTLVTRGASGAPANGDSTYPTLSGDGGWVAYYSLASNLVISDTNQCSDVFLWERQSGETRRISVSAGGAQANAASDLAAISYDGRFTAFYSAASNLLPGDTNGAPDIFVYDHQSGAVELVSLAWDGAQANGESDVPSISADGRYVAFYSFASNLAPFDTNKKTDVFRRDRLLGRTERASLGEWMQQGDGDSMCSAISAGGQVVAFYSYAENLAAGDTNGFADAFLRDFTRPVLEVRDYRLPLMFQAYTAAPVEDSP